MKLFKSSMPVVAIISLTAILVLTGCGAKTTTTTTQQTATIQKGNLTIDITAVGNLLYSDQQDLSFDTGGTLYELLVDVGSVVTKDQVVARLDQSVWQDNITTLETQLATKQQAVVTAQEQLSAKERTLTAKQRAVDAANRNVDLKQRAVAAAQQALDDANYSLTVKERGVTQAQINIFSAQIGVEQAQAAFEAGTGGQWADDNLAIKQQQYELTKASLDDALRAVETQKQTIANAQLAIQDAEQAVADAQVAVQEAQLDVQDATQSISDAKVSVESAQNALDNAQSSLDDAKSTHPELLSPIDGLVTATNVAAGATVSKGTKIMTIVDPSKFEADVLVSETDISKVTLNGKASVSLDALSGIAIPATIDSISPTATVQQGVVNYKVNVVLMSPQEIAAQLQQQSGNTGSGRSSSNFPNFTTGQLPSGITRGQSGGGSGTGAGVQSALAAGFAELRQGMTATVSIIIQQVNDVVLVPNRAITRQGQNTTVQVIKDGVISTRTITTGIANAQYTEVTDGLAEGDQVVYTITSSSSSSSSNSGFQGGGQFRIPIGGGGG